MIIRILIVAALQIAALAAMVADRMWLLSSGREVTMAVRPVDPSDPFRGEYVILTYDISRIQVWEVESDGEMRLGESVFVTMKPTGQPNGWSVTRVAHQKSDSVEDGSIVIKGRVTQNFREWSTSTEAWEREGQPDFYPPLSEKPKHLCPGGCPILTVDYGIESFFMQQGTARPIEEQRNDGSLSAKVAIDDSGRAGLKALLVDGQTLSESTLF
jgi:uncharacterized membrane-anchored protein